jgi:copper resistance protein C
MSLRIRVTGLLVGVVAAAFAVVTTATSAHAHADLVGTTPRSGATLDELPRTVSLVFSEQVSAPAFVRVAGPGGDVARGQVEIVDDTLSQRLVSTADPGRYSMSYRVTSADGHSITGTVPFSVTGGGSSGGGAGDDSGPSDNASGGSGGSSAGGDGDGSASDPADSETPRADAPAAEPQDDTAAAGGTGDDGGLGTGQLLLILAALAVGLVALAIGTRRALRHSVGMVEQRQGKPQGPRRG